VKSIRNIPPSNYRLDFRPASFFLDGKLFSATRRRSATICLNRMKRWVVAFSSLLALGQAFAQPDAEVVSVWSASRQFHVVSRRASGLPFARVEPDGPSGVFILNPVSAPAVASGTSVPLDPSLLVTSCERIKHALLQTLDQPDQWHGTVTIFINPALPKDRSPIPVEDYEPPVGWSYQMALPSRVEAKTLIQSVVGVLLMEAANRSAGSQAAEVPAWLAIGLAGHLGSENPATLVLRPESFVNTSRRSDPRVDPLRERFRDQPPLSFQELSWPSPDLLAGTNYDSYCASAQLFVEKILTFNDGRSCLRNLLGSLHQRLNWQAAFLNAFSSHFGSLLEVEKWWALATVNYGGQDFASRYGPWESWQRLQRALDVPVEVHFSPDRLPTQAEINLQDIIQTWEPAQASAALDRVAGTLTALRVRLDPSLAELLDGYLSTVVSYLNDTRRDRLVWLTTYQPSELAALRRSVCRQLDSLDARRDALRAGYVSRSEAVRAGAGLNPFAPTPSVNR
jgi:hypothetical protein